MFARKAATLEVLMMLPYPCGRMTRAAARMPRNTPRRCTPRVWSQLATSISSMPPIEPGTPALLNMTSRPPNTCTQVATARSTSASLETSVGTNAARSPSSEASRPPRAASTSARITLAPSAANSRAVASPIPLAAPVITARLPSSLPIFMRVTGTFDPVTSFRALSHEQRYGFDLLLCQVIPPDADGFARAVRSAAVDDPFRRDDEVHWHVMAGHRDCAGRTYLQLMHRGHADRLRPDQASPGRQRVFQIGEPAAFTQPCAVLSGRDGAHHDQIDLRQVAERNPPGGPGGAADRRRRARGTGEVVR